LTTSGDAFCKNGIQEAICKAYARARKFLVRKRLYMQTELGLGKRPLVKEG